MSYKDLFDKLWQQYSTEVPAAGDIFQLFNNAGEEIINDHIALRTFDDPRVGLNVLAQPFIKEGYVERGEYAFEKKHLFAKHFEHPDKDAPKVFISELIGKEFSPWLQTFTTQLIDRIPMNLLDNPTELLFCKTPWEPLCHKDYQQLLEESEYAAWLYAYGYRANHFTINVNHLKQFNSIEKVNDFLLSHGYDLNEAGGRIKGTPKDLLEQSSILAQKQLVAFMEGDIEIPSCYYEFAKRYEDKDGHLYQGFIAASADKIFESTDRQH